MDKYQLSELAGIPIDTMNRIVKGQEDLTLSLIGEIDKVLKIELLR